MNNNPSSFININEKRGLPRRYKVNQVVRWITIIVGLFLIYAAVSLYFKVNTESPTLQKVIPFIILFLTFDSLSRNLFTANTIVFSKEFLKFTFIGKKPVIIPFTSMKRMELYIKKKRTITILYNEGEIEKKFYFSMAFPNMLEIINSIAELAPHLEYDEYFKKLVITEEDKRKIAALTEAQKNS